MTPDVGRFDPRALCWNAAERRPRTPIRVGLGYALYLLVGALVAAPLNALAGPGAPLDSLRDTVVGAFGLNAAVTLAAYLFFPVWLFLVWKWIDRRRLRDYGFRVDGEWWRDLAFGAGLGTALMTGIFLVQSAAGWTSVTGFVVTDQSYIPFWTVAAGAVVLAPIGAAVEEFVLCGWLLTNLAEGFDRGPIGPRGAVLAAVLTSSAAFGGAHAANPNATLLSTAAVGFAGVLLALGYVLTGNLAVPLGLHVSWNFVQGFVYGFPVSGGGPAGSLVGTHTAGPALVTGGNFGPEAGLVGIGAIVAGAAAIVLWVRAREGAVGIAEGFTEPELRP